MLNDFINGLDLTVSLRMIDQREVFLYAELAAEFSEFSTVELRSIVRNDLVRYAKLTYYCLPYEVLDLLTQDRGQWFGFYPLREIVESDHNIFECRSCCW